jgi:hypothetical protein
MFCSENCQRKSFLSGHLLECGVHIPDITRYCSSSVIPTPALEIPPSSSALQFRKHALKTNELFLATRRFLTTFLAPFLCCDSSSREPPESGDEEDPLLQEKLAHALTEVLQCFPARVFSSTQRVPQTELSLSPSSIREYLTSFLPPLDFLSDSSAESEAVHESWLLCYALLVDLGVCPRRYSLILSWELYYFLSVHLLPLHLRPLKPGYLSAAVDTPPPSVTSPSPLLAELTSLCLSHQSISLSSPPQERRQEQPDASPSSVVEVIDLLFPNLFGHSDPPPPSKSHCGDASSSLENGCKLLQLLSLLQPDKGAGTGLHDSLALAQCVESGLHILEKGVSVFMVLLPRCSLTAKHSCCPSAHFSSSHGPLCPAVPSGERVGVADSLDQTLQNLSRSSAMTVSVVCLREFSCPSNTCEASFCSGLCGELSISLAPEASSLSGLARQEAMHHLPFLSSEICQCFRCLVETRGLSFALPQLCCEESDTDSQLFSSLASSLSKEKGIAAKSGPCVSSLLGLVYSFMANQQMREARDLLGPWLGSLEPIIASSSSSALDSLYGQLTHALGATYLEQGTSLTLLPRLSRR